MTMRRRIKILLENKHFQERERQNVKAASDTEINKIVTMAHDSSVGIVTIMMMFSIIVLSILVTDFI